MSYSHSLVLELISVSIPVVSASIIITLFFNLLLVIIISCIIVSTHRKIIIVILFLFLHLFFFKLLLLMLLKNDDFRLCKRCCWVIIELCLICSKFLLVVLLLSFEDYAGEFATCKRCPWLCIIIKILLLWIVICRQFFVFFLTSTYWFFLSKLSDRLAWFYRRMPRFGTLPRSSILFLRIILRDCYRLLLLRLHREGHGSCRWHLLAVTEGYVWLL